MYADHAARVNATVVPELKRLAEAADPNESVPPERLKQVPISLGALVSVLFCWGLRLIFGWRGQGSLLLCTTTMFSAFTLLVGAPRSWGTMGRDLAKKYSTAIALVATAALFLVFLEPFLPIMKTGDIAVLHGALLIWGSCTLTIFQVCVAQGLVEPESKLFLQLMQERMVSPLQVVIFWTVRSFLIVTVCLAGFAMFYVGLGWQMAHAFNITLVWFLFVLQNCMCAHVFQVAQS